MAGKSRIFPPSPRAKKQQLTSIDHPSRQRNRVHVCNCWSIRLRGPSSREGPFPLSPLASRITDPPRRLGSRRKISSTHRARLSLFPRRGGPVALHRRPRGPTSSPNPRCVQLAIQHRKHSRSRLARPTPFCGRKCFRTSRSSRRGRGKKKPRNSRLSWSAKSAAPWQRRDRPRVLALLPISPLPRRRLRDQPVPLSWFSQRPGSSIPSLLHQHRQPLRQRHRWQ